MKADSLGLDLKEVAWVAQFADVVPQMNEAGSGGGIVVEFRPVNMAVQSGAELAWAATAAA